MFVARLHRTTRGVDGMLGQRGQVGARVAGLLLPGLLNFRDGWRYGVVAQVGGGIEV